jgi:hypothetical protein
VLLKVNCLCFKGVGQRQAAEIVAEARAVKKNRAGSRGDQSDISEDRYGRKGGRRPGSRDEFMRKNGSRGESRSTIHN